MVLWAGSYYQRYIMWQLLCEIPSLKNYVTFSIGKTLYVSNDNDDYIFVIENINFILPVPYDNTAGFGDWSIKWDYH